MKNIKINIWGSVKETTNKIIIESGKTDYFVYIIDDNGKRVDKYYGGLKQLIDEFDYDVDWECGEMCCPICGKTNFEEEYETCKFCGWINEYLMFDNPSHTPKNKVSMEKYEQIYNQYKTQNPNFIYELGNKEEFNSCLQNYKKV